MLGTKHSVKPQDLSINDRYWIADEYGTMEEMILLEDIRLKNYIVEMPSLNTKTKKETLVLINTNFPRDIYVDKLNTNYRPMF